jgi:nucleotide-binding universal stress UspA family protein
VFQLDDPRSVLLEMSRDAAMVVLGSRGRESCAACSSARSGWPWSGTPTAPSSYTGRPTGVVRNGIVVGTDGSEESLAVLELANREASLRDLPLTVVHCFWDVDATASAAYAVGAPPFDLESEGLLLGESMSGIAEKFPEVNVHTALARGLPQDVLVTLGERMNLLVVGAHQAGRVDEPGHHGQEGVSRMLFGSVSVAVVEHASCPVAVVPTADVG